MAGLMDFLQAASNSAASNVSAPVDGLAWLLKKAGVPVGDAPMLGSEWMAQQGLTKPVRQSAVSLAGETASLLAPLAAAAKAPQIAAGLIKGQDVAKQGAVAVGQKGADMAGDYMAKSGLLQPATVWHGSPHKFDAFDSSKIGTGEGAQAYGHGLYLAETPDVAATYRNPGGPRSGTTPIDIDGIEAARWAQKPGLSAVEARAADAIARTRNPDYAIDYLKQDAGHSKVAAEAMDWIAANKQRFSDPGNLYKVDLPDEQIAKMLDWDKPLSQQSEFVRKALEPLGYRADPQALSAFDDALAAALSDAGPVSLPKMPANPMGSDIARGSGIFDGAAQVVKADRLSKAGIPGIRYLDGVSRTTGQGTSNYVVFPGNEGLLSILERNGVPLK